MRGTAHTAVLSRDKSTVPVTLPSSKISPRHTPLRTSLESAGSTEKEIEKGIFTRQGEGKIGREQEHGAR